MRPLPRLPRPKRFPIVKGNRLAQTLQKLETTIHNKLLLVRPFPAHTGSRYESIEQRFQVGRIHLPEAIGSFDT
jgi:hypothetical protein